MAAKRKKRKTSKRKSSVTKKDIKLVEKLSKNSLDLQKATLKLIETNNDVVKRIDKLVSLFEEASKHVVDVDEDRVAALTAKLETLLDQNKDLAKGLLLLERYFRGYNQDLKVPPRI